MCKSARQSLNAPANTYQNNKVESKNNFPATLAVRTPRAAALDGVCDAR
jgi:hypothetical protein